MKKFAQLILTAMCVLIQTDGSEDQKNTNKFDVILHVWKECPREIRHAFIGMVQLRNLSHNVHW
jgi:hypothetical protein